MQKVLIIRFSSIGDIVLTSPVLRALKQQKPGVEIHYITKKAYASVLEHSPYIDRLFLLEDSFKDVLNQLKKENYDLIIDLHRNLRSKRIKLVLRKPAVTFDKLNRQKWLMVRFKKNHLPKKHIVERYFDPLKKYGIENDHQGLDYFNGCEGNLNMPPFEELINEKFVALVLGGTYFTKQIPEEKLHEIIEQSELPVVLLGGPGEMELARKLQAQYFGKVQSAVGCAGLNQSAELIRLSHIVISGDTGLMHIAAAYNKETFSIWGNTIPEFGMYPYIPQYPDRVSISEVKDLKCRPCSKLGFHHCPKKHFDCMMKQDLSPLFKKLK